MDQDAPASLLKHEPLWHEAVHAVNAWRGACLQQFSAAEAAVTETLLLLATVPDRGGAVRLRHLIGQRFEDLERLLCEGGEFAGEGRAAAEALSDFRSVEDLRTALAHGQAKVTLERTGKWVVIFRHVSIRGRQAERCTLTVEQDEARDKLADLKRKGQKLGSVLGNLRRTLGS